MCFKITIEAAIEAGCDIPEDLNTEIFANFDGYLIVNRNQETPIDSDEEDKNIPPRTTKEVQKTLSTIRRYCQTGTVWLPVVPFNHWKMSFASVTFKKLFCLFVYTLFARSANHHVTCNNTYTWYSFSPCLCH